MKNKVNINGVEIEKIIENPQHLGGLVSKFNELLDALDEKKEEKRICQACNCGGAGSCSSGCQFKHICGKEEPKSTLREDIKEILCEAMYLKPEYLDPTGNKDTDKIISLFKDTLLKEVKKAEPLRLQGESTDFTQGQEWTMTQIKQIIKNI